MTPADTAGPERKEGRELHSAAYVVCFPLPTLSLGARTSGGCAVAIRLRGAAAPQQFVPHFRCP